MQEDSFRKLRDRVDQLEEELRALKIQLLEANKPGWRAIVGIHKNDKVFEQIVREGRRIRQADREAARREDASDKRETTKPKRQNTRRSK